MITDFSVFISLIFLIFDRCAWIRVTCYCFKMSFFQQEGDDSNLQYDDAAFLYFIASALSLAAIALVIPILSSLRTLIAGHEAQL